MYVSATVNTAFLPVFSISALFYEFENNSYLKPVIFLDMFSIALFLVTIELTDQKRRGSKATTYFFNLCTVYIFVCLILTKFIFTSLQHNLFRR